MGYWDALLELAVLVAVVQAPIAWAFTPRDELAGVYSPLDAGDVLVLVEWLVIYAVFAGDVWLSWKLGYMDSGALVVDRKKIRERYVRTRDWPSVRTRDWPSGRTRVAPPRRSS